MKRAVVLVVVNKLDLHSVLAPRRLQYIGPRPHLLLHRGANKRLGRRERGDCRGRNFRNMRCHQVERSRRSKRGHSGKARPAGWHLAHQHLPGCGVRHPGPPVQFLLQSEPQVIMSLDDQDKDIEAHKYSFMQLEFAQTSRR